MVRGAANSLARTDSVFVIPQRVNIRDYPLGIKTQIGNLHHRGFEAIVIMQILLTARIALDARLRYFSSH